jgi:hypothetical protein
VTGTRIEALRNWPDTIGKPIDPFRVPAAAGGISARQEILAKLVDKTTGIGRSISASNNEIGTAMVKGLAETFDLKLLAHQ